MRLLASTIACLTILISLAAPARASGFDSHQVPADAQWLIHLDVDAITASKFWDILQTQFASNPDYQRALAQLQALTGIQFPNDVHDVTLYGQSIARPDEAVVLLHAHIDRQRILGLFTLASGDSVTQQGGRDMYIWKDKGMTMYGAFPADDLAVVAHSQKSLDNALATLDGKNPSLEANTNLDAGATPGVLVYVSGRNFGELNAKAAILRRITSGWLAISEEPDHLEFSASLVAADADTARQVGASVEGIKALVALTAISSNDDPNAKNVAKMFDSLTYTTQDQTVTARWPVALDLIATAVGQAGLAFHYDGTRAMVGYRPHTTAPAVRPGN